MAEEVFFNCTVGGAVQVHVKDGRIIRVRPLRLGADDAPPWTIQADGRTFTAPRKTTLSPFVFTERTRLYGEDRIKYPMKRVDFDPAGDRHPENRGKSPYVRISWDEALDLVAGEIRRVQSAYGRESVAAMTSSHHCWGNVGYKMSTFARFFKLLGYTAVFDNPDSWEGWHWGSVHTWGFHWRLGVSEQYDLLQDALKNSEQFLWWSADPDTTRGGYCGQESAIWRQWLKELGREHVFIDPFCNYTAVRMADKWIAPRPGSDAALALGVAHVWLEEGSYDHEYVETHTTGFDRFKQYVLGEEDGVPKTPAWAGQIAGVEPRDIKALARWWASKPTMLCCGARGGFGGACRTPYAHEWARLMVMLQAMQGLGKPGVNIWSGAAGAPYDGWFNFPAYADPEANLCGDGSPTSIPKKNAVNPVRQRLYRLLMPDAFLNPPISWLGEGFCGESVEQQFKPYTYPMDGCSEVKLFYRYGGSFIGTMTETNRWVQMYQSPKLETVVNQSIWWDPEVKFADVVLPACTNLEREDIAEMGNAGGYGYQGSNGCNYRVIVYQQKCIEPLHESKPDYEILRELAARLGFEEDYTDGGKTQQDWIRRMYEHSDLPKHISLEELKEKGYFIVPPPKGEPTPGLRWFYEGRPCDTPDRNPIAEGKLGTPSGKIEFVSTGLGDRFGEDPERPPLPHYIPMPEGPGSEWAKKFPLQLVTPHPRFSYHTHYDAHSPWLAEIPGHRLRKDGYDWITVRLHPEDARPRGIQTGDIIKVFNDRGATLGMAHVTERVRPGSVHCYGSSGKYDPIEPGKAYSVDRGGCVNLVTPRRMMSRNAPGMAPNACGVEVARWEEV